jgi:hypothetical protein
MEVVEERVLPHFAGEWIDYACTEKGQIYFFV